MTKNTLTPIAERFWSKVEKTDGCWIWRGSKDDGGYGTITKGRAGAGVSKAHRVSYEINIGPIPPGLFVCHKCDVRDCVNPDHLFVGSAKDNNQDMATKGRAVGNRVLGSRTHCSRGHEYTESNTSRVKDGSRVCRTCARDNARRYYRESHPGSKRWRKYKNEPVLVM